MKTTGAHILALTALVAASACSSRDTAEDATASPGMSATAEAPAVTAPPATQPTAKDFMGYELTMDKMRKWVAVTKAWTTIQGTAADSAAMRTVRIASDPISETERKIEGIELLKRVFSAEGLSPREYYMITGAYGMASLPASKNVEFVKTNKAELDNLMKELQTIRR